MIDRVVVDYVKTFGQPGIFLGCEPKWTREDKADPKSKQVQASDKNGGGLKWTATVAVKTKAFEKEKIENLSITLTSPTQPCANVPVGQMVVIESLEAGFMKQERGYSIFFSAAGIRPVSAQAQAATARQ
jgi:hypothetical protein